MEEVKVKNILGEEVKVKICFPVGDSWWYKKFFSSECKKCPNYIGKSGAIEIVKKLEKIKKEKMRWQSPAKEEILGVCVQGLKPKIIVRRKRGALKNCPTRPNER